MCKNYSDIRCTTNFNDRTHAIFVLRSLSISWGSNSKRSHGMNPVGSLLMHQKLVPRRCDFPSDCLRAAVNKEHAVSGCITLQIIAKIELAQTLLPVVPAAQKSAPPPPNHFALYRQQRKACAKVGWLMLAVGQQLMRHAGKRP